MAEKYITDFDNITTNLRTNLKNYLEEIDKLMPDIGSSKIKEYIQLYNDVDTNQMLKLILHISKILQLLNRNSDLELDINNNNNNFNFSDKKQISDKLKIINNSTHLIYYYIVSLFNTIKYDSNNSLEINGDELSETNLGTDVRYTIDKIFETILLYI